MSDHYLMETYLHDVAYGMQRYSRTNDYIFPIETNSDLVSRGEVVNLYDRDSDYYFRMPGLWRDLGFLSYLYEDLKPSQNRTTARRNWFDRFCEVKPR